LSVTLQSLLVDCFKTKKHGIQAESLPKFEDLLIAQEHIAARLKIVTFPDSAAGNRFAKLHTVLGLNEGYVVHDKNSRLAHLCQFLDRALRCSRGSYDHRTSTRCKRHSPMDSPG